MRSGYVTDILLGHLVDDFGNIYRTWAGELGGIMGAVSCAMGAFYCDSYTDWDFAEVMQ